MYLLLISVRVKINAICEEVTHKLNAWWSPKQLFKKAFYIFLLMNCHAVSQIFLSPSPLTWLREPRVLDLAASWSCPRSRHPLDSQTHGVPGWFVELITIGTFPATEFRANFSQLCYWFSCDYFFYSFILCFLRGTRFYVFLK